MVAARRAILGQVGWNTQHKLEWLHSLKLQWSSGWAKGTQILGYEGQVLTTEPYDALCPPEADILTGPLHASHVARPAPAMPGRAHNCWPPHLLLHHLFHSLSERSLPPVCPFSCPTFPLGLSVEDQKTSNTGWFPSSYLPLWINKCHIFPHAAWPFHILSTIKQRKTHINQRLYSGDYYTFIVNFEK